VNSSTDQMISLLSYQILKVKVGFSFSFSFFLGGGEGG
jgi:hypothetical protein